jgi:homocysteine S-methyltransferase
MVARPRRRHAADQRLIRHSDVRGGTLWTGGFELPEFAMFPLLDRPEALAALQGMYRAYLETAARHGFGVIIGGLDYRASRDWGRLLGHTPESLAGLQHRAIAFLRDVAGPYQDRVPSILYAGIVGPRRDAYTADLAITAEEAEEYHSEQIGNLASAGVDLVEAMTFNNVAEAVGLARAAARYGLPASISFTLDGSSRLQSGPTLGEAIAAVDALTGEAQPAFYGINCTHPVEFMPALNEPGEWFERVRCLRPNAAPADKAALCTLGHLEAGDPAGLGEFMGGLAERYRHLDIWGGCCGTWDDHLDQIARSVRHARGLSETTTS